MTDRLRTLLGAFRLTVRAAAPENVLSRLSRDRVRFWDLRRDDDFTVTLTVRRRDIDRAAQLIARTQGEITERTALGLPVVTRRLRRRWAFFAAMALVLASMQVVTDFVWHVDVAGNDRVPAEAIRRELAELGVGFGTWGFDIVPQDLKNRMLAEIPELEWLTVVRSGGLATAVVREREPTPEVVDRRLVTNLVAVRDCLITDVEALSGQAVCAPGDTVRAGELLISGWMDLELYPGHPRPGRGLRPDVAPARGRDAGGDRLPDVRGGDPPAVRAGAGADADKFLRRQWKLGAGL